MLFGVESRSKWVEKSGPEMVGLEVGGGSLFVALV